MSTKQKYIIIVTAIVLVISGLGLLFYLYRGPDPTLVYSKTAGSPANDFAYCVSTDAGGNSFLAGSTEGSIDNNQNKGYRDIFVAKFDSAGNKLWSKTFGTDSWEEAYSTALDSNGNLYVSGYTYGGLEGNTSTGKYDAFLLKLDSDGNLLWARETGTNENDFSYAVATDPSGNAYLTGYTYGALPGAVNAGKADVFVIKYDANGVIQWSKQFGSQADDIAYSISADLKGGIAISGYTMGALDGNKNEGVADAFVARLDANGVNQWIKQVGTSGPDESWDVATDKDGNAYVTGFTGGAFGKAKSKGAFDIFIIKYDPSGNMLWNKQTGTAENDYSHAISVDDEGSAYLTGYTYGSFCNFKNEGKADMLALKFNTNGKFLWASQTGTPQDDFSFGISLDSSKNAYISGETAGALSGNPNAGKYDISIHKFSNPEKEGFFGKVKRIFKNALRKLGISK